MSALERASWIGSIVGGIFAVLGLLLIGWQLLLAHVQRRDALLLSTTQVLLGIDVVLASYSDVAGKLRGPGVWAGEKAQCPSSPEEFALVEPYMGVFERIFIAHGAGQVDAKTLFDLYGYRLWNIWKNRKIVDEKLEHSERRASWARLIALTYVLEVHCQCRFPLHADKYFPDELFRRRRDRSIATKLRKTHDLRKCSSFKDACEGASDLTRDWKRDEKPKVIPEAEINTGHRRADGID